MTYESLITLIRDLAQPDAQPTVIALDGSSGAGKSTLAQILSSALSAAVVPVDDFYAGGTDDEWLALSPESRVEQVIDWRQLREEVIEPLRARKHASWHPLDFDPQAGWVGWKDETVTVAPSGVVILEGAYSSHPRLLDLIKLTVLVDTPAAERAKRIEAREEAALAARWHDIWDPAETLYFDAIRPSSSFDLVVSGL